MAASAARIQLSKDRAAAQQAKNLATTLAARARNTPPSPSEPTNSGTSSAGTNTSSAGTNTSSASTGTGMINSVLPPGATLPSTKDVTPLTTQYTNAVKPVTPPKAPGPVNTYTPAQAEASLATATPFTVTPEQTVESRIQGLIGSNGPLMQQAARRAQGRANDRGMLNSTMAIQSGQQAVFDTAFPIASQDAAAFERAATNTVQAQNTVSLTNANLTTNVGLVNSGAINTALSKASDFANTERLDLALATIAQTTQLNVADRNNLSAQIVARGNNDTKLFVESMGNIATFAGQVLDAETAISLANMDVDLRLQIQNLADTNNLATQQSRTSGTLFVNALDNIQAIFENKEMTASTKRSEIESLLGLLNTGLQAAALTGAVEINVVYGVNKNQTGVGVVSSSLGGDPSAVAPPAPEKPPVPVPSPGSGNAAPIGAVDTSPWGGNQWY